jgi:hypothetical protein
MPFSFFVKDTGTGIAKENLDLVFDRFWQEDSGLSRNYGGTGLGLSISQKLVEIMGGKIWVESKKGIGSEFYFTIPQRSFNDQSQDVENNVDSNGVHDEGLTVLVAEDEEINFLYLEAVLSGWGLNVIQAANGAEAVEKFKERTRWIWC